jgi:septum formation protein
MKKDILYLGSQSPARQKLLNDAGIPFKLLSHTSDEQPRIGTSAFKDYVMAVAQDKMRLLGLPEASKFQDEYLFALTADTMVRDTVTGELQGKALNRDHAIRMIKGRKNHPIEVITACCVEKFYLGNDGWQRGEKEQWISTASVEFYIDDSEVETYLTKLPQAIKCSGAGYIEDHGLSYLKSVNGSYTAIMGLPLYELRQALKKMGFAF